MVSKATHATHLARAGQAGQRTASVPTFCSCQADERMLAMTPLADSPFLTLVLSFLILWACAWIGAKVLGKYAAGGQQVREDFRTVLAACLTLLGLIIGFSFSMAVSRYDLRHSAESAEADAIGTEYVRADLLPPSEAETTRQLLRSYLAERFSSSALGIEIVFARSMSRPPAYN